MYPSLVLAVYVLALRQRLLRSFHRWAASLLNYDPSINQSSARRTSGCTQSNGNSACGANGIPQYIPAGLTNPQCDEYPYASTSEGVAGSILRCVNGADNGSEGGQLGAFYRMSIAQGGCGGVACAFVLFFFNYDQIAYCYYEDGPNDGYEFKKVNGAYVNAKRDVSYRRGLSSGGYVAHEPRSDAFVPRSKRREFLLSDGRKTMLLGGDMDTDYVGVTIANTRGVGNATIVKELLGNEKSEGLQ